MIDLGNSVKVLAFAVSSMAAFQQFPPVASLNSCSKSCANNASINEHPGFPEPDNPNRSYFVSSPSYFSQPYVTSQEELALEIVKPYPLSQENEESYRPSSVTLPFSYIGMVFHQFLQLNSSIFKTMHMEKNRSILFNF